MAQTVYVERREGESWREVVSAFLQFCAKEKKTTRIGCHEGNYQFSPKDGSFYAAISIPGHSPQLVERLKEWARRDGRTIKHEEEGRHKRI